MTEPLIIMLDILPVLAMVLAIVCIPLLGDGPCRERPVVRPDRRRAAISPPCSHQSPPEQRKA
jgi:hypothetical protein